MNKIINKHLNLIVIISGLINAILVYFYELSCPWKKNFNIDCAGCGATRMFKALIRLDFYQAFRFNPLIFSLFWLGLIYIVYVCICKLKKIKYYKIQDRDLIILLALVIVFTILRNIPGFEFLKPTIVR